MRKIAILGCGRWASFHAWYQAVKLGNEVLLWGRAGDTTYEKLAKKRKNDFWKLPKNVGLTSNLDEALGFSETVFIIISAQGMRELSGFIATTLSEGELGAKNFILCMKGIDEKSSLTLSQLLRKELGTDKSTVNVWVGPGHVQEYLEGQPGVMIIAGEREEIAKQIASDFSSETLKLYASPDLIGAEVGAAAKNVLGIAAGVLDGIGYSSLKGALMARGVYEVSKLVTAMGGNKMTPYGLSHLGDFEATLFSRNSNNRRFGEVLVEHLKKVGAENVTNKSFIGRVGRVKPEQLADIYGLSLAEGVTTSIALRSLATKHNVEMPICETVYEILHKGKDPQKAVWEYFKRENKTEFH